MPPPGQATWAEDDYGSPLPAPISTHVLADLSPVNLAGIASPLFWDWLPKNPALLLPHAIWRGPIGAESARRDNVA